MKHCFVRVHCGKNVTVEVAADSLHAGFVRACDELGLKPGTGGLLPPCNLLADSGWLLILTVGLVLGQAETWQEQADFRTKITGCGAAGHAWPAGLFS